MDADHLPNPFRQWPLPQYLKVSCQASWQQTEAIIKIYKYYLVNSIFNHFPELYNHRSKSQSGTQLKHIPTSTAQVK